MTKPKKPGNKPGYIRTSVDVGFDLMEDILAEINSNKLRKLSDGIKRPASVSAILCDRARRCMFAKKS